MQDLKKNIVKILDLYIVYISSYGPVSGRFNNY